MCAESLNVESVLLYIAYLHDAVTCDLDNDSYDRAKDGCPGCLVALLYLVYEWSDAHV